jgi:TatD DNase family protein
MRLFDTHAHIQDDQFDADRDAMIQRARDAGLAGMIVLGVDLFSSQQAVDLASANDFIFAAAGCHPHEADSMDDEALAALAELAHQPEVVAVGEIGLDFYRNLSSRERQIEVFERQLETARDAGKPVAVHCRDAQDAMLPIVEAWSRSMGGSLPGGRPLGVMHYFAGDAELGERYVSLGFMISIHTSITYPKSDRLREVARSLPLDVLVVETDSPYGAPQSLRGQRNEPANVLAAVEKIAEVRGEPIERMAEATTANALRLFGIESRLTQPAGSRRKS